MFSNALVNWADVLVEHEYDASRPQLWRWLAGRALVVVDALSDVAAGRSPFGRYDNAIAEDNAVELLRAKGWLVMPPETKARVQIRFLDELMPAPQSIAA